MKIRRSLLQDVVDVTTRVGDGAYGPTYNPIVRVRCGVDETRRLVRDSNGDETTSEATLTLHPRSVVLDQDGAPTGAHVDPLQVFTPESPVTINGRTTRVLTTKTHTVRSSTVAVEVTCA